MGQKSNLNGLNVSYLKDWNSIWYLSSVEYSKVLNEDLLLYRLVRSLNLYKKVNRAIKLFNIMKIRVCRISNCIIIKLYYSFELRLKRNQHSFRWLKKWKKMNLRYITTKLIININNLFSNNHSVYISFYKMCKLSLKVDVNFLAKKLAFLIENRIKFRSRLVKKMISETKKLSFGVFVSCSGRLNGVDIARIDSISHGAIPFQNINKNVSYGYSVANTKKGLQNLKVYINI